MSLNLSHPSQKQSLLAVVGICIAVVLLLVLASVYGRFLKTSVVPSATQYSATGNLKTDTLEPGTYTLKFTGREAGSSASHSLQFEITGGVSATSSPNAAATPTSTPVPAY